MRWLQAKLDRCFHRHHNQLDAQDIQTNLAHFTAAAIAASFAWCVDKVEDVYVRRRCSKRFSDATIVRQLTQYAGTNNPCARYTPDYVEAITFAWLAKKRLAGEGLNLTSITGSTQAVYPGAVYLV
ncbi:MAG: anhydro-N-acetylmuramic acid kinase [Arenicellales bacterium WSBS_2016_MAG_OTU3]